MTRHLKSKSMRRMRGFTLLETAVSLAILAIGFVIFISGYTAVTKNQRRLAEEAAAKASAVELLEFFRSFGTGLNLLAYLDTNPASPALSAYPLCTMVNQVNRNTKFVGQPDPTTPIHPSDWDGLAGADAANRFYQIHIIDVETLDVQDPRCGQIPGALTPPILGLRERVMVTVGVEWYSGGSADNGLKQVAQSIILPN